MRGASPDSIAMPKDSGWLNGDVFLQFHTTCSANRKKLGPVNFEWPC